MNTWRNTVVTSTLKELQDKYAPTKEPDEEFHTAITRDGTYENYSISRRGVVINSKTGKQLTWSSRGTAINRLYPNITFSRNNKATRYPVHKLVALTFYKELDKPEWVNKVWELLPDDIKFKFLVDVLVVDHIDGITWNPNVENLRFTTLGTNTIKGNPND